jgi:Protein of unknown function (DUF429)
VTPVTLLGLDFSCAPSKRKPLTLAWGRRLGQVVKLDRVDELPTLAQLDELIAPGASASARHPDLAHGFVMGCDFPFGLPRGFVDALSLHGPGNLPAHLVDLHDTAKGQAADRLIQSLHQHCVDRAGFQALVDGWGQSWQTDRPAGSKLTHRVTDRAVPGISSTSPLQTRYVPVGKMYFEGLHRLVAADLTLPGLRTGRADAIALEAYPGLLAGELLGKRSYKSDAQASHDRLIARMDLVDALEQGRTRLGLRLKLSPAQRDQLVADPKGDRLDAALCLLQAAWAQAMQSEQTAPSAANWGLPAHIDPVEGWILTA